MSIISENSNFTNNNSSTIRGNSTIEIEAASYVQNTNASTIRTNSLAIVTGSFNNISSNPSATNPAGNVITDSFALSVAGDFNYLDDYLNNGNISHANDQYFTARNGDFTNTTNIRLTGNFEVTADSFTNIDNASIEANNLKFILGDYLNNNVGSTLNGNSIVIEAENYVHNINASTIESDGNVSIIVENDSFINNNSSILKGNNVSIEAKTFAQNTNASTIEAADSFSIIIAEGGFNNRNDSTINANNAIDIYARSSVQNVNASTIEADNVSIIAENSDFTNDSGSTVKGNSTVDIVAGDIVYNINTSTIETDSLTIEALTWTNISSDPSADSPAGNIIADSFALSVERGAVAGIFDYSSDYLDNGNVSHASTQYFTIRDGAFSFSTRNKIELTGNFGVTADSMGVLGNDIVAANLSFVVRDLSFANSYLLKANNIYIEANGRINNNNNATIDAANLTIISHNDSFYNNGVGTITGGNIIADK